MDRRKWQEITLSKPDKLARLAKAPWAENLTPRELAALSDLFFVCRVKRGDPVYQEGDKEAFMCLIVEGEIEIQKGCESQQTMLLSTLGPGETVGEMAIIDGGERSASAVAATDSTLFVLSRLNLRQLIHENRQLWNKFLLAMATLLSMRLRATNNLLLEYGTTPEPHA